MRCQKTYLAEGFCRNETFHASRWCRWHKIIEEFRADLSRFSRIAAQGMMFGSGTLACGVVYSLWMFARQGGLVWPMLAAFLGAAASKFFADGCIAQDHPFAQFALWGRLLAFGLVGEIVCGAVLGYHLLLHPAEARAIVTALGAAPFWIKYGPPLLTAGIMIEVGSSARLFVRRVLLRRVPAFNSAVTTLMVFMAAGALRPLWLAPAEAPAPTGQPASAAPVAGRAAPLKPPEANPGAIEKSQADRFWQPAIGEPYGTPLLAAIVLGFILAEVINKRMRSSEEARAVFRATVWPSFPVCWGSPLWGAAGSRFVMVWTKIQNPWVFGIVALVLTAVSTIVGTRLVIRQYLAALRRQAESPSGARERRQELLLFLRGASGAEGNSFRARLLAQTLDEIELAVQYSGTGCVEGYHKDGDLVVVRMVGPSADSIFGALRDWLEGASIQAGSFIVLRYRAGVERLIEL